MKGRRRHSWVIATGIAVAVLVLLWLVPPFRIVSLKAARQGLGAKAFDAASFVDQFWKERLIPAADRAADAAALLRELRADPKAARAKYARNVGLGDTHYYFIKGEGRVVKVDGKGISLAVDPDSSTAQIIITTGNIFGNSVRDGSGL